MTERVAAFIVRSRWIVAALWVVIGAVAVVRAPRTPELLNVRGGADRETEAARADRLLDSRFARPFSEFFAVALESPAPFTDGAPRAALDSITEELRREPYVRSLLSYHSPADSIFLSPDGRLTFFLVSIDAPRGDSVGKLVTRFRRSLHQAVERVPYRDAYRTWVTGRSPLDLDVRLVSTEDSKRLEARVIPLTLLILVLAFGALVAAVLPLLVGFLAVSISLTIIGLVAVHHPMSVFVLNLTTMIGLGVGIDYSLLVVTRFREELTKGYRRREAAERTFRTAGMAVLTSRAHRGRGVRCADADPAGRNQERRNRGADRGRCGGAALDHAVARPPRDDRPRYRSSPLAGSAAYLVPLPARVGKVGALARAESRARADPGRYRGGDPHRPAVLDQDRTPGTQLVAIPHRGGRRSRSARPHRGVGYLFPIRMVVEFPEGRTATELTGLRALQHLSDSLRADPRVRDVKSLVDLTPGQSLLAYSLIYSDLDSARARYKEAIDAYLSRDGRMALIDVIPSDSTSLTTSMELV